MNIEEFAKSLDGREMGKELTKEEEHLTKENRWVVVFGHGHMKFFESMKMMKDFVWVLFLKCQRLHNE